jgi:hypothetical protein
MAWSIKGSYLENCTCEMPCPCTVSLDWGADYDRCQAVLVFHVESGEVDGVDVSGPTVVGIVDSPKVMSEGNWRLGVLISDDASDEQAEKLGAVFGGQLGGPMEALGPLVGENLGMERIPMEFSRENGSHRLKLGDGQVAADDIVPFGLESGEPAKLTGIFHPAGDTLTVASSSSTELSAFGIDFATDHKSAFTGSFAWSG